MGNMGHCRFENTYQDLLDCQETLQQEGVEALESEASKDEKPHIQHLIELCREIHKEFSE